MIFLSFSCDSLFLPPPPPLFRSLFYLFLHQLGAVDATQAQELAQKYGVQGYPTIKAFPPGPKKGPQDYNGPREAAGIVDYATEVGNMHARAPVTRGGGGGCCRKKIVCRQ